MNENKYLLYTSSPIDHWEDFIHIKHVGKYILNYISCNPECDFHYSEVWFSILDKIVWALTICKMVDKNLRSPDFYIHLEMCDEQFKAFVLFKSDNNGTVNMIVNDCFDIENVVKKIPHEQNCEWEKHSKNE